jgi:hypothetical protein
VSSTAGNRSSGGPTTSGFAAIRAHAGAKTAGPYDPRVGSFVLEIRAAFDTPDGYYGDVTLAGVRIGNGHDLAIGDALLVPSELAAVSR